MSKFKSNLTNEEKAILINGDTEAPFSGEYNDFNEVGGYVCKLCGVKLFNSTSDGLDKYVSE